MEIARIILYHHSTHTSCLRKAQSVVSPMVLPRPDMLKTEGLELIATTHRMDTINYYDIILTVICYLLF